MKTTTKLLAAIALCTLSALSFAATPKSYSVSSPDGTLVATVTNAETLSWTLVKDGVTILEPSAIGMTLGDGSVYAAGKLKGRPVLRSVRGSSIPSPVYKKAQVKEEYDELTLKFKDFNLVFRAYDEAVAYRFVSKAKEDFIVKGEQAEFAFGKDCEGLFPFIAVNTSTLETQFCSSFESKYIVSSLVGMPSGRLAFLPVSVSKDGYRVNITESDLSGYPGMYVYNASFTGDGSVDVGPAGAATSLKGVFPPYPDKVEQGGHNMLQGMVKSRKPYICQASAGQAFPWRIVAVASDDAQLLDSDIVWLLGKPSEGDFSWVKPGKVAWDWWNNWNLYGVDFETGINNDTYKYYIDFAASKGIEYVILDEGWAVNKKADLFQIVPEIDLPMLVDHAAQKGVGLILWAGYKAFDKDMERVCKTYSEMGIKGFKIDFMDRDDQEMVEFCERAAAMCAKYHLLADFHGMYKPSGLNRQYPNVVNFEGVRGLENMKWASFEQYDAVTYDVQVPFIRMFAGPMDYTQGAMDNRQKKSYHVSNGEPCSQGTRCRQLAMYTVFEAPLTMLCDSPSNYMHEPECTDFIAGVPTVWDETRALCGKMGEYVAIARRSGTRWYVGVLNNWDVRELDLDLGFIAGRSITVMRDGINAGKVGRDYKKVTMTVPADGKMKVRLAPGGGWTCCTE